jgi:hypothetical protein
MTRSKLSTKAILLAGGIGLSMAGFAGLQPAAAQTYSDGYDCPVGSVQNTVYGCSSPDYANDYGYLPNYDYDYLPYSGNGHERDGRHDFGHGLAHGMAASVNDGASVTVLRGAPSQGLARLGDDGFDHAMTGGVSNVDHGPGFAHFGGGGFDHGMGAEGTIVHHGMGFHSIGVAHFGGGGFAHGIGGGFNHGVGFAHAGAFGGGGHR